METPNVHFSTIERGTQIDISEKLGNDRGGGIRATKTERSWTDFCSWPNPPQLPSRPGNTIQLLLLLHSYLRAWILVNDFALWNWEMSILLALPLIHLENYYPLIDNFLIICCIMKWTLCREEIIKI